MLIRVVEDAETTVSLRCHCRLHILDFVSPEDSFAEEARELDVFQGLVTFNQLLDALLR